MAYSTFYYMGFVEEGDIIHEELWRKIIKNLRILKEEGVGQGTDQTGSGSWDRMGDVEPHTVILANDINDLINDVLYLANQGLPPSDLRKEIGRKAELWKYIDLPTSEETVFASLMNKMINNAQLLALQKSWTTETISESISVSLAAVQEITQTITESISVTAEHVYTQTITQTISVSVS